METTAARSGAFGYRFYPDRLKGEGFFIAGFRKQGDEEITQAYSFKNKNQLSRATKDELEAIKKVMASTMANNGTAVLNCFFMTFKFLSVNDAPKVWEPDNG